MSMHHHCDRCDVAAIAEATFESQYALPAGWTPIGGIGRTTQILCASCTRALVEFIDTPPPTVTLHGELVGIDPPGLPPDRVIVTVHAEVDPRLLGATVTITPRSEP